MPFQKDSKELKRKSIKSLTGIRFFAAFYVLLFHSGLSFAKNAGLNDKIINFLSHGYLGVGLFFILSGFILAYNYPEIHFNKSFLFKFYKARFSRLYPVYFLALLLVLPFVYQSLDIHSIASVLTMTQSWTLKNTDMGYVWLFQAWTLSVEFFFYLIFPFIWNFINKFSLKNVYILTFFVCIAIVYFATPILAPGEFVKIGLEAYQLPLPIFRAFEFIFGLLLCRIYILTKSVFVAKSGSVYLNIVLILMILSFSNSIYFLSLAIVLVGILIFQIASESSSIRSFLGSNTLVLLGGANYSIYLLHIPIREYSKLVFGNSLVKFISPIALIFVSILIFKYYEEPVRKWILKR